MSWSRLVSARSRDVLYDLMVHVLWADGRASPDELIAARGAADALGMDPGPLEPEPSARPPFEALGLDQLGPLERPLAYAAAAWMAMADRELAITENGTLRRLNLALALEPRLTTFIDGAVMDGAHAGEDRDRGGHRRSLESLLDRVVAVLLGP